MFCKNCGKEIPDEAAFCPNCGYSQQDVNRQGTTPPPVSYTVSYSNPADSANMKKAPYNKMCIIGIIVSGISLLLNFFGLVGIAGTILSIMGLISCKEKNENGKALAIIGIVIGIFSILYAFVVLCSI